MASRLFKITTANRKERSLVSGSNLEELLIDACDNLGISFDSTCKIVLEEDGTSIKRFELLEKLSTLYPNSPLLLMLLIGDEKWQKKDFGSEINKSSTVISGRGENDHSLNENESGPSSSVVQNLVLPWNEIIPLGMMNEASQPISYELDLIKNVGNYQLHIIKDTSLGTCKKLAELVVNKFPKVFGYQTWNGNTVYCSGVSQLQTRLYDRVRKLSHGRKRKNTCDNDETSLNEVSITRYGKNQDKYGCVAFEPALPEGETKESQMLKKTLLIQSFTLEKPITVEEEYNLLAETYPSQRICINKREMLNLSLSQILKEHWPHLSEKRHFLAHCSTLIGINVLSVWIENTSKKICIIYDYFRSYVHKHKKLKYVPEKVKKLQEILNNVNIKCTNLRSDLPKALAFIELIPTFFNEMNLLSLIDSTATDEDIMNINNDSNRPILVVKGVSIYDETSNIYIIMDKTILVQTDSVLEGILLFCLCHYMYGYNYGENISSSLEFIQRMLMDINPQTGHKRGRKNKSKKTEEDSKVMRLIANIVSFNS
ncbi:uncharacterized protein LOC127289931 [Leptopilina boulardi]|uniref:uncharacterized protein LOC127289931 n=1 Tax=Leptopilina boulardi TaxID=63433 RepID=UPI0021F519CC|nr:uncharacterized protein LOC127289931 [Leptopilina boulardi]